MLDGGEKEKLILGKNSARVRSRCRAAPPRPAPGRPWRKRFTGHAAVRALCVQGYPTGAWSPGPARRPTDLHTVNRGALSCQFLWVVWMCGFSHINRISHPQNLQKLGL